MTLKLVDILCGKYEKVLDDIERLTSNCEGEKEEAAHEEAAVLLSEFADSTAERLEECSSTDRPVIEEMLGRVRCQEGLQYLAIGNLGKGKPPLLQGDAEKP